MEDSRSMTDDETGYVGDDDGILSISHPQDGYSEDEFIVRTHYLRLGYFMSDITKCMIISRLD